MAAENQGKVFVSTELGGGGSASATSVKIAKRGISNVLMHAGIRSGEPERGPSVNLDTMSPECFITSEHCGLIEMSHDLGNRGERR